MELSVCIPCYNEEENISELVYRIQKVFSHKSINGEIVLVNDKSTDNTGEIIKDIAKSSSNILYLEHSSNLGIVAAWKTALKSASGDYICLMDGDLQNLPEDVSRLYREIKFSNVDLVQGVRSHVGRHKDIRYFISVSLNFILNFLFSMCLKDNKSGFIICRREVLAGILNYRYNYRYFQTFITVSAKAKGYSIREVETLFEKRILGKSFMSAIPIKVILLSILDLVKGLFEFRFFSKREMHLEGFIRENPPCEKSEKLSLPRRLYFGFYAFLMPLHHWMLSYNAARYYRELRVSQWFGIEKIREYQLVKLKHILNHAYNHVAYYREAFDSLGIKPSDIKSLDDISKLPIITKDDIRENIYFDLIADNHNKKEMLKVTTSGSTGEPFVCYADKSQLEIRWAATLRSAEWTGYKFGDRQLRLWHQTIGMSKIQVLKERLDGVLSRRKFIPAFNIKEENLEKMVKTISKWKPVLIDGYAESFNFLAYYLRNCKASLKIKPKGIFSSAQTLPQQSRETIEKEFQCSVFDKYGSREFSGIAYECEAHDGHHVVDECYIVEIIKDGKQAKPGEVGEVVVTDLNNYCMPFIRYKIGDLAVAVDNSKPCSCGRGIGRIGNIEGRVQSIIVGTENQYIPGTFFAHLFKDYEYAVRQFQVVQEERGAIILKIVKSKRYSIVVLNKILNTLHKHLGKSMKINVTFVSKIPLGKTGKHQHSISKLKLDFQKEVKLYENTCSGN